jgi:hypothetical protein
MHRFEAFLVGIWQSGNESQKMSQSALREHMKALQSKNWVQKSIGNRAGGDARFDMVVCEVQSGRDCACRPLPAKHVDLPVPRSGAVVLTVGVKRSDKLAYLTRTYFCDPSEQQRKVYRGVCKLLESVSQELKVGTTVKDVREKSAALAEEQFEKKGHKIREVQTGKFEVYVHLAITADGKNEPTVLEDTDTIAEGAYIVTAGFALTHTHVRFVGKHTPLESVWLQDTVWVQGRSGGVTMLLTQNASKEEACVMYTSGAADEQDDLKVAVRALTDVQAVLEAQKGQSKLKKQILEILGNQELQDMLEREQEDDADGAGDEEGEEEEDKMDKADGEGNEQEEEEEEGEQDAEEPDDDTTVPYHRIGGHI